MCIASVRHPFTPHMFSTPRIFLTPSAFLLTFGYYSVLWFYVSFLAVSRSECSYRTVLCNFRLITYRLYDGASALYRNSPYVHRVTCMYSSDSHINTYSVKIASCQSTCIFTDLSFTQVCLLSLSLSVSVPVCTAGARICGTQLEN